MPWIWALSCLKGSSPLARSWAPSAPPRAHPAFLPSWFHLLMKRLVFSSVCPSQNTCGKFQKVKVLRNRIHFPPHRLPEGGCFVFRMESLYLLSTTFSISDVPISRSLLHKTRFILSVINLRCWHYAPRYLIWWTHRTPAALSICGCPLWKQAMLVYFYFEWS